MKKQYLSLQSYHTSTSKKRTCQKKIKISRQKKYFAKSILLVYSKSEQQMLSFGYKQIPESERSASCFENTYASCFMDDNRKRMITGTILQVVFVIIPMILYVASEREWIICGIIAIVFASIFLLLDIIFYFRNNKRE